MSTIVTRAGKGSPLTHNEVDANFNNLNNDKYQSGSSPSFAGTTLSSGNLTFSSTAQRITGDFSNATVASRLMFQGSVTNATTFVGLIPNGSGTTSSINCFGNSDPTNAPFIRLLQNSTNDSQIRSDITGSGTYVPITFYTGGSERMRLDTSGNLGIGTASPTTGYKLSVSAATASNTVTGGINIQSNRSYSTSNNGVIFSAIANNGTLGTHDFGALIFQEAPISNGGSAYVRMFAGGASTTGAAANKFLEGYFDGSLLNYVAAYTNGTERMRIDSSGNVGIGSTAAAFAKLAIAGTLPTSSNLSVGLDIVGTIPSGTTSGFDGVLTRSVTAAASFTLTNLHNFRATQGTLGAGSTVTNQYGFVADSSLTGATNNYGFYSNIASGSNRWNFYAAGTAQNYFAGRLGINNTAFVDNEMLRVTQSSANTGVFIDITAASSTASAGIAIRKQDNNNTTAQTYMAFAYNAGANGAGGIQGNGGTGPQFFNSSDARLKENVSDLDGQLAKIMALKPRTFDFINGPKGCTGFIAQEMEEIYPDAIGETPDGYKTIGGVSVMEARLIKAIQELSAKVAALEAK